MSCSRWLRTGSRQRSKPKPHRVSTSKGGFFLIWTSACVAYRLEKHFSYPIAVMKFPVEEVGATGIAGQQVRPAMENNPNFEIAALAASERSASKTFEEAITDANSGMRRWYVNGGEPPAAALKLEVQDAKAMRLDGIGLVFAAV